MPIKASSNRQRIFDLVRDPHSSVPLYLQLKHHIVHLISLGEYPPGAPLPSVRQLASELGLATATVQRTYGELQAQGLLVGQTGRGVFAADLTAGVPDLTAERSDVLRDLLARTVSQAKSLGFDDDQILSTVRDLVTGSPTQGASPPRVVLVAPRLEFAEKYRAHLRDALSSLGVTVDALLLSELQERRDAVLDPLEPIVCLVSLVSIFPDLRHLASHRGTPLFGLVVDLMEETQQDLVELPPDAVIGLVAEDHYLPSARALVRLYRGSEDQTIYAGHSRQRALQRIMRECPIIVHTLGSKGLLEGRVPPSTQLIELRYRPNAASLARLRAIVSAQGAPPPPGGANGSQTGKHEDTGETARRKRRVSVAAVS